MSFLSSNCLNCDKTGHTTRYCKNPIVSYGILLFRKEDNKIQYLLIQRKDTIGYINFIRGKYNNTREIQILLSEMTITEKLRIINNSFEVIWDTLWKNHNSKIYKKEKDFAKSKFYSYDKESLRDTLSETIWEEEEYCIPKGRKNCVGETNIQCALREFTEETCYSKTEIEVHSKYCLEEIFWGSDCQVYKHIYFLAEFKGNPEPRQLSFISQAEIKQVRWFSYKEVMNIFRNYEASKRQVVFQAHKIICEKFKDKK